MKGDSAWGKMDSQANKQEGLVDVKSQGKDGHSWLLKPRLLTVPK